MGLPDYPASSVEHQVTSDSHTPPANTQREVNMLTLM